MNQSENTNSFVNLNLLSPILANIKKAGYEKPTPIQSKAIPEILAGHDLWGCAQTGTGKTAAFALPIIQNLSKKWGKPQPKSVRCLVLSPTRELALQIYENFQIYSAGLGLRSACIFGGVGMSAQVTAVKDGVDVLVATPGRLLDLINQNKLNIRQINIFVLDEADRMLDMGFIHDIKKVLTMIPKERQTLFFSATMSPEIEKLSSSMLKNPVKIEVNPPAKTADLVDQFVMYVEQPKKRELLIHLLKKPEFYRVIVFTRTKHAASRISDMLTKNKITSAAIHGNKSQNARQRALEQFKNNEIQVLIATDIAARGIDVDGITHVINYDVPHQSDSYVHRIGRTARAGQSGIAISFCTTEEKSFIRDIEKLIKQSIPVLEDQPFHSNEISSAKAVSAGKAKAMIEKKVDTKGGFRDPRYIPKKKKRFFRGFGKSSKK